MEMDVAITGSNGLIGSALARSLEHDGHRVVRVVRPESPDVRGDVVVWDPRHGVIDLDGLAGLDAVVHLAGAGIGDRRWTRERKREILRSRTEGTGLLARTLASLHSPPGVLVSGSATGYYGDGGDRELTESSPGGLGFGAEVVRAWEAAAAPAIDAGIRTVFVRTANVLTPNGGLLPYLLTPFRIGLGARFGSGRQWFPWVTLGDEVAAIRFAIESPEVEGPVNVAAPEAVTNRGFTAALGRVLRRPAPWVAPTPVLRLIAGAERADEALLSSAKVVPAALSRAGFVFDDPELEPALRRILAPANDRSAPAEVPVR
jgi:uncharacterized protein (TIGR01777 family)